MRLNNLLTPLFAAVLTFGMPYGTKAKVSYERIEENPGNSQEGIEDFINNYLSMERVIKCIKKYADKFQDKHEKLYLIQNEARHYFLLLAERDNPVKEDDRDIYYVKPSGIYLDFWGDGSLDKVILSGLRPVYKDLDDNDETDQLIKNEYKISLFVLEKQLTK